MINEVQLIIAKGEVIIGDVIEPSIPTSSVKIGVNYFEGIESLVGKSITIIDPSLNEYEGGVISVVDFGSVFPGLWNIYFLNNVLFDGASGWTFKIDTTEQYYIDLYENESISQNWSFTDLAELKATGSYSREFRIPLTDRNQEVFGAVASVNYLSANTTDTTFNTKIPAEIRVNTMPIVRGHLRVMKVFKQLNRLVDIQVAFYAETPDLFRAVGEKKLSDIAALATLNEVVNYDNVTTETPDRIWSLCDRGQLWSNAGEVGSRPIKDENYPVQAGDLTPAISWWYLLKNIVSEAGFDLVASSLENIIEDYYMPWCNAPQLLYLADVNDYLFTAYKSGTLTLSVNSTAGTFYTGLTEVFDNNGDFTPGTGIYTAPVGGVYSFSGLFNFQASSFSFADRVICTIFSEVNGDFTNIASTGYFSTSVMSQGFNFTRQLNAGDVVQFGFNARCVKNIGGSFVTAGSCSLDLIAGNGDINNPHVRLVNVAINSGQTIDYSLNAPDMRQIDFINDVIKMHNCAIIPSRIIPNQIAIIPQNNYLGTGDVIDWTDKLDISKDIVISSTVDIQKSKFQFTYSAGEDAYSKVYKDLNRVYGDFQVEGYTVNPSTPPSDFAKGNQQIQLVTRSTPSANIPGTANAIPCFYNDSLEFVAPGPRALYSASTILINLFDEVGATASPSTQVPLLNHYSNVFTNVTDFDLNWAPEIPPHANTVIANPVNNLFNLYWRNYMNDLYSPEGRIMEASFALDLNDILTFSFADKIWIEDAYWRILEISDYKVGLKESTKVKLLKFLDQVNDCSSYPVSTTANGEVNFESGGDPVEPTEDCCSRYGYFWDEVNGVCWAFNNNGQFRNSLIQNNPSSTNSLLDVAPNSIANGVKISIESGNSNMLAVGQDLNLTKFVNGSNLLGKNVNVNLPGIHVGGGYRAGNPTATEFGWAQFGQFALHRYPTVTASGQSWELFIEGVSNEHIELPDDTLWSCLFNLTIKDIAGVSETSLHHFTLEKIGGIAYASAITTLNTIGAVGAYTFTLGIDTTTDTDEHRIRITTTGGTYPEAFFFIGSIQYQQSKTA
jgi:hypothetical protein